LKDSISKLADAFNVFKRQHVKYENDVGELEETDEVPVVI